MFPRREQGLGAAWPTILVGCHALLNSLFFPFQGAGITRWELFRTQGVRCLSEKGRAFMLANQRHARSKSTRSQDSVINIQEMSSPCPSNNIIPLQECPLRLPWKAAVFVTLIEDHSDIIENQELPAGRAPNSWSKLCLSETQNYQRGCQLTSIKNKICMLAPCVDFFPRISLHHDDHTVPQREKAQGIRECGKDLLKASPLAQRSILEANRKPTRGRG